ncbi:hypothetical protein HID58_094594 [Brassica napus]|uniref:Transcription repressor n=1 Tax=Brassica napus TaxID=3708 RepID=A0ABQ7X6S1_BRANA|nr:hypothetical protein HID58_094594 [Brassica napus]
MGHVSGGNKDAYGNVCGVRRGRAREAVVPTSYLKHPLFRSSSTSHMTSYTVSSRSLSVFQDVVNAIESCHGNFDFGDFVEEFL